MKWKRRKKMSNWAVLLAGIPLLWAANAQAASFDCAKAKTAVEKMICADAELSKLDEEMGKTFAKVLNNTTNRNELKATQKEWLRERNKCSVAECLQQAYQDRLAALNSMPTQQQARIRLSNENPGPMIYYGDVRKDVQVGEAKERFPFGKEPRPTGFFQLVGSKNDRLCAEALAAFNEPGNFVVGDNMARWLAEDRWLTDNSKKVQFHLLSDLDAGSSWPLFMPLEYAAVDIDGDGIQEHTYRWGYLDGGWGPNEQSRMISDTPLHEQKTAMKEAENECLKERANANSPDTPEYCKNALIYKNVIGYGKWPHWKMADNANEWNPMITRFSQMTKLPPGVWGFARNPRGYCDGLRNVGYEGGSLWDFYQLASATVLVVKPTYLRLPTPPEYLVFLASRDTARLQCIIVPRTWGTSNDNRPCNEQ